MPRGPRVDFRINEDTSSCLVVGPSLTKKSGDFDKERYEWFRQVCILDLGKYSLWLWLGRSQIQVMTGHILTDVFPSLPIPYFLFILHPITQPFLFAMLRLRTIPECKYIYKCVLIVKGQWLKLPIYVMIASAQTVPEVCFEWYGVADHVPCTCRFGVC